MTHSRSGHRDNYVRPAMCLAVVDLAVLPALVCLAVVAPT